jgi:hypothetical protein
LASPRSCLPLKGLTFPGVICADRLSLPVSGTTVSLSGTATGTGL